MNKADRIFFFRSTVSSFVHQRLQDKYDFERNISGRTGLATRGRRFPAGRGLKYTD
jgi:hypothetical protein